MSQTDLLLDVTNLYKIYKSGDAQKTIETVALKGVNLTVRKGDFIAIMGPSGSGKTTLINCLSGLDTPSAGDIIYYLKDGGKVKLSHLNEKQRDQFRIGKLAVVFQTENLVHSLTAKENAEIPLNFLNIKDKSVIPKVFSSLGIDHRLNHKPDQLSGGEKQRVSLACALVYNPEIIIADEPTGELDVDTTEEVMDAFKKISELGVTIIVVTHNPMVAQKANLKYEMHDGVLRMTGEAVSLSGDILAVDEDEFGRLSIPSSWLQQLSIVDDLFGLVRLNGQLLLVNPTNSNFTSKSYVHVDSQGRISIPDDIKKGKNFRWHIRKSPNFIELLAQTQENN